MLSAWKAPHCSFNLGHVGKGIQSCGRMISDADASRVKPAGCGTEVSPACALQLTPVLFSDHLVFFFPNSKKGPDNHDPAPRQLEGSRMEQGREEAFQRSTKHSFPCMYRAVTGDMDPLVHWRRVVHGGLRH